MRKAVLMMLLAVVSSSAAAEWVVVSDSDAAVTYVDVDTIRKNGNLVIMWTLYDFKTARVAAAGKPYLSSRSETELDCGEEKIRTLAFFWHSRNMGKGEVVTSDSFPEKWEPIPPGSAGKRLWQIACEK
jgi:hypothetical protein